MRSNYCQKEACENHSPERFHNASQYLKKHFSLPLAYIVTTFRRSLGKCYSCTDVHSCSASLLSYHFCSVANAVSRSCGIFVSFFSYLKMHLPMHTKLMQ